jgi:hypothetical protein
MSEATLKLVKVGANKIGVIKAVREITNLGLKEAKDALDVLPKTLLENAPSSVVEIAAKKLKDAGAEIELIVVSADIQSTAQGIIVGGNSDLNHLVEVCFPKQPDLALKLQKYVDDFGLSLGWYVGLIRTGMVQ